MTRLPSSAVPDKLPAPPRLPELEADESTIPGTPQAWREVVQSFRVMERRFESQAETLAELTNVVKATADQVMAMSKRSQEDHEKLTRLLREHEANHRGLQVGCHGSR